MNSFLNSILKDRSKIFHEGDNEPIEYIEDVSGIDVAIYTTSSNELFLTTGPYNSNINYGIKIPVEITSFKNLEIFINSNVEELIELNRKYNNYITSSFEKTFFNDVYNHDEEDKYFYEDDECF